MVLSRGGFDPDPADICPCLETFSVVTTGEGGASGRRPGVRLNVLRHAGHTPPQRIMNRKCHGETLVRRRNPERSKISDSRAPPKGRGGAGGSSPQRCAGCWATLQPGLLRGSRFLSRQNGQACLTSCVTWLGRSVTVFPSLGASNSHRNGGKSPWTRGRGDEGTGSAPSESRPSLGRGRSFTETPKSLRACGTKRSSYLLE